MFAQVAKKRWQLFRRRYYVFFSYNRSHSKLVESHVRLVSTIDKTFFDLLNMEPGSQWRTQVDNVISRTKVFFLYWCNHASTSEAVSFELDRAKFYQCKVVPILLDATPLPEEIAGIHAVTFLKSSDCMSISFGGSDRDPWKDPKTRGERGKSEWERYIEENSRRVAHIIDCEIRQNFFGDDNQ